MRKALETTAGQYMQQARKNGRAVLVYASSPDEHGEATPKLWLCQLGKSLIVCEDASLADIESGAEYLVRVNPHDTIASVVSAWEESRGERKATRRAELGRAPSRTMVTTALKVRAVAGRLLGEEGEPWP
jgi:hypothetical protein